MSVGLQQKCGCQSITDRQDLWLLLLLFLPQRLLLPLTLTLFYRCCCFCFHAQTESNACNKKKHNHFFKEESQVKQHKQKKKQNSSRGCDSWLRLKPQHKSQLLVFFSCCCCAAVLKWRLWCLLCWGWFSFCSILEAQTVFFRSLSSHLHSNPGTLCPGGYLSDPQAGAISPTPDKRILVYGVKNSVYKNYWTAAEPA